MRIRSDQRHQLRLLVLVGVQFEEGGVVGLVEIQNLNQMPLDIGLFVGTARS